MSSCSLDDGSLVETGDDSIFNNSLPKEEPLVETEVLPYRVILSPDKETLVNNEIVSSYDPRDEPYNANDPIPLYVLSPLLFPLVILLILPIMCYTIYLLLKHKKNMNSMEKRFFIIFFIVQLIIVISAILGCVFIHHVDIVLSIWGIIYIIACIEFHHILNIREKPVSKSYNKKWMDYGAIIFLILSFPLSIMISPFILMVTEPGKHVPVYYV